MRLATVILVLAGIAVALVHVRREEIAVRHEIQRLQIRRVALRRTLWEQQVRLGYLAAPEEVRRRAEIAIGRCIDDESREMVWDD
jgi:hypothetical protein